MESGGTGVGAIRFTSSFIVVVKAEGFSTDVPLLAVVVAFSCTITDPLAAGAAASERHGARSSRAPQLESFIFIAINIIIII